ncbi:MAG: exosortase U [Fuerstiella sp.]
MSTSDLNVPRNAVFVVSVVVLLHVIFLWQMMNWLWARDHYQFFPLIIIGTAALAAFRLQGAKWADSPTFSLRVICYLLGSFSLMLLATLANSHWLGTVSAMLLTWAGIWYVGGREIADRLRGPFFFLALAIPLPLNLDLNLIIAMQKLATASAGQLLDYFRITHVLSGVAIRTDQREFMVEDACSGIHSLFSCIAAMAFWGIVYRYSLLRILITIAQTTAWVLVANAVRVFLIVFARHRFDADLESGTLHELLGILTYAAALCLSLSTDQLLRFLVPLGFKPFQADSISGGYTRYSQSSDQNESALRKMNLISSKSNRFLNRPIAFFETKPILPIAALLIMFVPLSGIAVAQQFRNRASNVAPHFVESIAASVPQTLLPQRIGEWTQQSSRVVNRSPDDPLGTNSVVWMFEGNGIVANVSVDGYYSQFHDLSGCYSALGWELESTTNREIGSPQFSVTELALYKDNGEFGLSLFSCFDSIHTPIRPPAATGSALRNLLNRLRSGQLIGEQAQPVNPPVYQIQAMTTRQSQLLEHEKKLVEQLFVSVHDIVLGRMRSERKTP